MNREISIFSREFAYNMLDTSPRAYSHGLARSICGLALYKVNNSGEHVQILDIATKK